LSKDPAWLNELENIKPLAQGKTAAQVKSSFNPVHHTILPHLQRLTPLNILEHTLTCTAALAPEHNKQLLKDLKKGKILPTATLDLHGLMQAEAIQTLNIWLTEAHIHNHRCVLIITGKGKGYGEHKNMGLLKYHLPLWLSYHPSVIAIHTATPYYGGTGAYFILLKKS
jgi:DNA-nicking Smr family endonuclease